MQHTMEQKEAFWVLGIQERANPMQVNYQEFWGKFEQRAGEIGPLAVEEQGYGVYFPADGGDEVDVFGGMAVAEGTDAPEGLVLRNVPGGEYAVFECAMADIGKTWGAIYGEWLPAAGLAPDESSPCFEQFPPDCHSGGANVRIFVPIKG